MRSAAIQSGREPARVPTQVHTIQQTPNRHTREQIRQEIRQEERNRMATIAVVACSVVAIIAIIIFLVLLVNGVLFNQGDTTVTVPQLVGEYYDNIRDIQGLDITIGDYKHSDTVAKDKVISQTPAYGAKVVQGTKVTVVISLGPEPEVKIMDNLVLMPQEEAKAYLTRLGMNPMMKYEFHDTVKKGSVIRTDPASGTELKDGQTVWLVCSSGPMIEKVEMPKLVGMSYAAAKAELELMGFTGDISYVRRESNEPRDEVIEQPYAKGELVDITEDIVLTISKGPKETEPPEKPTEKDKDPQTSQKPQTTKTVSIDLPTDKEEDYTVGLYLEGKAVLDTALVSAGTPSIDVTLTGSGVVYYDLYIDGSYYKTVKVEFS